MTWDAAEHQPCDFSACKTSRKNPLNDKLNIITFAMQTKFNFLIQCASFSFSNYTHMSGPLDFAGKHD
jgi:hypothetical protein